MDENVQVSPPQTYAAAEVDEKAPRTITVIPSPAFRPNWPVQIVYLGKHDMRSGRGAHDYVTVAGCTTESVNRNVNRGKAAGANCLTIPYGRRAFYFSSLEGSVRLICGLRVITPGKQNFVCMAVLVHTRAPGQKHLPRLHFDISKVNDEEDIQYYKEDDPVDCVTLWAFKGSSAFPVRNAKLRILDSLNALLAIDP